MSRAVRNFAYGAIVRERSFRVGGSKVTRGINEKRGQKVRWESVNVLINIL